MRRLSPRLLNPPWESGDSPRRPGRRLATPPPSPCWSAAACGGGGWGPRTRA